MRRFFTAVAAAFVFLVLVVPMTIAFAQDTTVQFDGFLGWLRPYLLEALSLLIGAAVLWATKKFHDWTGITIEAKHREALQSALTNGANLALERLPPHPVDVHSANLANAIRYVLDSVPDAVAYFDLTPERIAQLLRPKLVGAIASETVT